MATVPSGSEREREGETERKKKGIAIKIQLGAILTVKTDDKISTCLRWNDKRIVNMLSTFQNNETVDKERRSKNATGRLEIVKKPKMVEDYNKYMGGVDRNDQMVPYNSFTQVNKFIRITCKLIILKEMVEIILPSSSCLHR